MYPAKWYFRKHESQPTTEVAIRRSFSEDLYLVMPAFSLQEQSASMEIVVNPLVNWVWVGFGFLALGTFIALLPEAAFSFAVTVVLVKLIDATVGFTLPPEAERAGLDRALHNEVGFDLSAVDETVAVATAEPRAAKVPPDGQRRFTVVVEGAKNGDLMHAWSALCQPKDRPPPEEFQAVYPYVTTVQGNRFRFRGGDPDQMKENLQRLLQPHMGRQGVHVRIES